MSALLIAGRIQTRNRILERIGERLDLKHLRRSPERMQATTKLLACALFTGRTNKQSKRATKLLRFAGKPFHKARTRNAKSSRSTRFSHRGGLYFIAAARRAAGQGKLRFLPTPPSLGDSSLRSSLHTRISREALLPCRRAPHRTWMSANVASLPMSSAGRSGPNRLPYWDVRASGRAQCDS